MLYSREQVTYTVLTALNILSIHIPTAAIVNYIVWGYILPRRIKSRAETIYA